MSEVHVRPRDAVLDEVVRRLVAAFGPERVYLFGSTARSERGPHSDYDLMVVVREASEPSYRLSQRAHSLLWDLGTAADVLVWPADRFDGQRHLRASLPGTISVRASSCMSLDAAKLAEAKRWLERAKSDLRASVQLLEAQPGLVGAALFHAQLPRGSHSRRSWRGTTFRSGGRTTGGAREAGPGAGSHTGGVRRPSRAPGRLRVDLSVSGRDHGATVEETTDALATARGVYEAVVGRLPSGET